MKHVLRILFFSLISLPFTGWAQRDQIVTQAGQEIRCKIMEESPSRFTYVYLDPSGRVRQSQIFKSLVKSFGYQVYSEDLSKDKIFQDPKKATEVSRFEIPKTQQPPKAQQPTKTRKPPKNLKPLPPTKPEIPRQNLDEVSHQGWQIGVRGGLTNYTVPLQGLDQSSLAYYEQLSRGYTLGGEAHYYVSKLVGLGVIATATQSQATAPDVLYFNGFSKQFQTNDLETTRQLLYVGPSIHLRHILDTKAMVYTRLSGGRFFLRDAGLYALTPYEGKGQNWAGSAAVGFDFLLGKSEKKNGLVLNLEASYTYAQQNQVNFGEGLVALPSPLDLNHFSITLGVKWMQFPRKLAY